MPIHDIIDNRNHRLADHINCILASTESARFAVGYFFLSGLTSIAERLAGVRELRLLIGNTTNHETLEQIAEGYGRLELVAERVEEQKLNVIVLVPAALRAPSRSVPCVGRPG